MHQLSRDFETENMDMVQRRWDETWRTTIAYNIQQ
jgi:hypothetical protein